MNSDKNYEKLTEIIDKLQEALAQNKQDKNIQAELEQAQAELKELIRENKKK